MSMLERWAIEPSPTPRDPQRHTLFVKAQKIDLYAVLREFGAMCGRPQKTSKDDYNYSLTFHQINAKDLEHIEQFLVSLSGKAPAKKTPQPPASEPPSKTSAPESPAPPIVKDEPQPKTEAPAKTPPIELKTAEVFSVTAAAEAPRDVPRSDSLYGAALSPDPSQTFDSLIAGPFNRFAHAAGTAVVSNPGSMYNPLVLFGAPGVGKTHFLGAIGRSLEERSGGKPVFYTTGCKLSWACDLAVSQGKTNDLLLSVEKSAGVLIDDVHLMVFSEHNKTVLQAVIHHCLNAGKPLVMTSVYPPKALQFLEDALQFEIGSGYAVEIKLAGYEAQLQILRAAMARAGFDEGEDGARQLQGVLGQSFLDLNRWLKRMRSLKALRLSRGENPSTKEILALLLAQPSIPSPLLEDIAGLLRKMRSLNVSTEPKAKIMALVFPAGHEQYAQYLLLQFRDAAERGGLGLPVKALATQAYDPNQVYGVPGAIGGACRNSGASAVLAVGPMPGTQLAAHEGELYHALNHILADMQLPSSMVPYSQLTDPAVYFTAVLDTYFGFWTPWQL